MGSTKGFFEFKLLEAQALSASFSSDPIDCTKCDNIAINVAASNVTDNTGSFFVDHRIYKNSGADGASAWAQLTFSTNPQLSDGDEVFLINLNQIPKGQLRLRFVAAGGTPDGDIDVWVSGKEI